MEKIKIIEAGNELGLGGTEYVIQLYSKYLNKENFKVTVVGLREGGARVAQIEALGVKVIILNGDLDQLAQLLLQTDVFHWHGEGSLNAELFHVVKANKPKLVIQTNIFGKYTHTNLYDTIDYDLYVSKMILIRRMYYDQELENDFEDKRKTLYNPVDVDQINSLLPDPDQMQLFKTQHGLQDYFIVGRIGRADEAKFDFITLEGFAAFSKKVDNARFLLVGATPNMLVYAAELQIADKLIVFENTPELAQLLYYYSAMDVYLAISKIGESFGMVIAEAMTIGVPVITVSTEDRDNAQIELVDNGQTGLVVSHDADLIGEAIYSLYSNTDLRKRLSVAAQYKVKHAYKADLVVKSLENLIYQHFNWPERNQEKSLLVDFSFDIVDDYIQRCSDLWEPGYQFNL